MAFLPLFPILHGVTGSVFREHLLSPTSFSQSLNFASRISFLPFCTSFVPIWTRLFCSSSWKPVQTPMRSAALALAAKSPCHPPWSHSPAASLMMVGLSCRPGVWFYRGAFRLTLGEGSRCLLLLGTPCCVGSRVSQTWALLSAVHFSLKPEEPNAWVTFLSAGPTYLKPESTFGVMP